MGRTTCDACQRDLGSCLCDRWAAEKRALLQRIEALESSPGLEWVSVEEELPEELEHLLLTDGVELAMGCLIGELQGEENDWSRKDERYFDRKVTHWARVEPPKA